MIIYGLRKENTENRIVLFRPQQDENLGKGFVSNEVTEERTVDGENKKRFTKEESYLVPTGLFLKTIIDGSSL